MSETQLKNSNNIAVIGASIAQKPIIITKTISSLTENSTTNNLQK
jgi:hypothetical protein